MVVITTPSFGGSTSCQTGFKWVEVLLNNVTTRVCQEMTDAEKASEKHHKDLALGLFLGLGLGIPLLVGLLCCCRHCVRKNREHDAWLRNIELAQRQQAARKEAEQKEAEV